MDNITHSLIGAVLGQAGLKRRTGLAMPALILAANLPDVDAPCVLYGVESLAMRRGLTHGPIGILVLPLLLAGVLIAYDRWQARRGTRPESRLPVHSGWLVALCYLGALSHPAFDWLNNYGIRLLEPFSSQWFYGDALFIIDPWLLAMLGAGVWLSLRRERGGVEAWTRPARVAVAAAMAYVGANVLISSTAANATREALEKSALPSAGQILVVSDAMLFAIWRREMLWRTAGHYGQGEYNILTGKAFLPVPGLVEDAERLTDATPAVAPGLHNMSDPRIAAWARHDPAARAFLFWSRMPVAELHDDHIILRDQRFLDSSASVQFSVTLRPPAQ